MKNNKAFQTIVGAFVLLTLWRLYQEGWFDALLRQPSEGDEVESVDLIAMLIGAVFSSLQMVGLLAIGIVAGLLPILQSAFDGILQMFKPKDEDVPQVDESELNKVLTQLSERLSKLEKPDAD